jgi:predicted oxidoreductase
MNKSSSSPRLHGRSLVCIESCNVLHDNSVSDIGQADTYTDQLIMQFEMTAQDMDVVRSYDGDTKIAAVRGPTRWLEDSLLELFMTGKR